MPSFLINLNNYSSYSFIEYYTKSILFFYFTPNFNKYAYKLLNINIKFTLYIYINI